MGNQGGACILYNVIQAMHRTNNLDTYNRLVELHNTVSKEHIKLKKEFELVRNDYEKYRPMLEQMLKARKDLEKEMRMKD